MARGATLAQALADTSKLGSHDGRKIIRARVVVKKAGDGLSQAVGIEPQIFHHGQRVSVALEGTIGGVKYAPIVEKGTDTGVLEVLFELDTETITFVEREIVAEALDAQRDRIKAANDAAKGQRTLDDAAADAEGEPAEPTTRRRSRAKKAADDAGE